MSPVYSGSITPKPSVLRLIAIQDSQPRSIFNIYCAVCSSFGPTSLLPTFLRILCRQWHQRSWRYHAQSEHCGKGSTTVPRRGLESLSISVLVRAECIRKTFNSRNLYVGESRPIHQIFDHSTPAVVGLPTNVTRPTRAKRRGF